MITIILADDHDAIRKMAKKSLLAEPGFQVIGDTATGKETIALVQNLKPDILVTDISMNGLNGIEVTKRVRSQSPGTQVVIWSLHAITGYVLETMKVGAMGYVLKESGLDVLAAAVREVAQGHLYLGPPLSERDLKLYQQRLQGCHVHEGCRTHLD